jgi:DNA-binding GntR family transcriptional regulator
MPRRKALPESPAPEAPPADAAADRGRSVEEIAQDIAAAIIEKRLPPGTRLREEALGRVYAVSRTKIRAALLIVSKDKLIEIVPDKGAFVSKPSVQEAREVFAVRRALEAEVVRLFVARAKPADYRMLDQHIKVERATLGGAAPGSLRERLLGDFHVQLAEAAGNKVLADLVAELVARCSLIAMLYESTNDPHCSSDEHGEFLRIAKSGDAAAAVDCMLRHLQRVEERLSFEPAAAERHLDLVKALLS